MENKCHICHLSPIPPPSGGLLVASGVVAIVNGRPFKCLSQAPRVPWLATASALVSHCKCLG